MLLNKSKADGTFSNLIEIALVNGEAPFFKNMTDSTKKPSWANDQGLRKDSLEMAVTSLCGRTR
jgi:hypothetical protein